MVGHGEGGLLGTVYSERGVVAPYLISEFEIIITASVWLKLLGGKELDLAV
jgi:hypothetical protein